MAKRKRKKCIRLSMEHKNKLEKLLKSKQLSGRIFKRALILQMLNQSLKQDFIAKTMKVSRRTIANIKNRYLQKGLDFTLYDSPRPGKNKIITPRKTQEIIAMACTDPPDGYSRWTLSLLTENAIKKRLYIRLARKKSESS